MQRESLDGYAAKEDRKNAQSFPRSNREPGFVLPCHNEESRSRFDKLTLFEMFHMQKGNWYPEKTERIDDRILHVKV
jgi:hypothetical protein